MGNNKLLIFLAEDYKIIDSYGFKPTDTDLVIMSPFLKLTTTYNKFNKIYYDEYLEEEKKNKNYKFINHFIWDWYKDNNNKDISLIDGLSIGESFVTSVQMLMTKTLKVHDSLDLILDKESKVFFSNNLSNFIKTILIEVCDKKKIKYNEIKNSKKFVENVNNQESIFNGELRDQRWLRKYSSLLTVVFANILIYSQNHKLKNDKLKLLSIGSEKLNKSTEEEYNNDIIKIKPLSKLRDLFLYFNKNYFIYISYKKKQGKNNTVKSINQKIIENISNKYKFNNTDTIQKILRDEILLYSEDLYNHYHAYKSLIKRLRPQIILITGETHELYQSITRAARQSQVKTILTSHGFSDFGYKAFKLGNSKIFDGALAFGEDQYENYIEQGFSNDEVVKSVFPYFKNFFPFKQTDKNKLYKKALILFPEPNNLCSGQSLLAIDDYFYNIIRILKQLDIKILGFKSRYNSHTEIKNKEGYLEFNGEKYLHFYGYDNLLKYIKNIDFVVGPLCSAIYEVFLEGKDYYAFQNDDIAKYTPNYRDSIYKFLHISSNPSELLENIKDRKLFKRNYSIYDLTYLKDIAKEDQIFEKFDKSILKLTSNIYEK
tara:strand:+ start:45377 stop:47176 length:1800 start_codon:yes stop_codon:yes gene_type:complete